MLKRKVGDEWRQSTRAWVKVNGTWREIKSLYKKENGAWNKVSGITTVSQVYQQFFTGSGTPVQQPVSFTQPFQSPNPPAQQPVPAQQPFFFSQPFSTQQPYTVIESGLYIQHLWFAQPSPTTVPFSYQQLNPVQTPSANVSTTPTGVECAGAPVPTSPTSFVPFASTPNPSNQLSPQNNGMCFPTVSFTPVTVQQPRPIQTPFFTPSTCYNQQPVTFDQPSPPYPCPPCVPSTVPRSCPKQTPVQCTFSNPQPNSVTSTPTGNPFPGGQCLPIPGTVTSPATYQQNGTPLTCNPQPNSVTSSPGGTPYPGGQCLPQPGFVNSPTPTCTPNFTPVTSPRPDCPPGFTPVSSPRPDCTPNFTAVSSPRPDCPPAGTQPRPAKQGGPVVLPRQCQIPSPKQCQIPAPRACQIEVPKTCPSPAPITCPYQTPRQCPQQTPRTCPYQVTIPGTVASSPTGTAYQQNGSPLSCFPQPGTVNSGPGPVAYQQNGTPLTCTPQPVQTCSTCTTIVATTDNDGIPCPNTETTPTGQPIRRTSGFAPGGPFTPGICYPNLVPFPCQIESFTPNFTANFGTPCVPGNTSGPPGPGPALPWTPGPTPPGSRLCFPIPVASQQPVQTSRTVTQWNPGTQPTPVTVTPGNMPAGLLAPAPVISANTDNCGPTSPVGAGRCGVQPFEQFIIAKTSQSTVGSGGLPAPSTGSATIQDHRAPDGLVYSRYRQTGPLIAVNPQEHPGPGQPIFSWNPDPFTPPTGSVPFPITPGGIAIPGPVGTVVPSTFASGGAFEANNRQYQTTPTGVRCFTISPAFNFGDNTSMTDVSVRTPSAPPANPVVYPNFGPNPNAPVYVAICYPSVSGGTNQVESFTNVQTTPTGVRCGPNAQNSFCFPVQQPVSPFVGTNQVTTTPSGVSCPPGSVTPGGQPVPRSAPGLCYPFDLGTVVSGYASTTRLRNIWR